MLIATAALPREKRPGTHCIVDWVGPRADLDGCGNLAPTRTRSPDRPARSESLHRLHYPRGTHILQKYNNDLKPVGASRAHGASSILRTIKYCQSNRRYFQQYQALAQDSSGVQTGVHSRSCCANTPWLTEHNLATDSSLSVHSQLPITIVATSHRRQVEITDSYTPPPKTDLKWHINRELLRFN